MKRFSSSLVITDAKQANEKHQRKELVTGAREGRSTEPWRYFVIGKRLSSGQMMLWSVSITSEVSTMGKALTFPASFLLSYFKDDLDQAL